MQLLPENEKRLRELLRVFLEENTKLNLSALRTEEQCWNGNVLDSIEAIGDAISESRSPSTTSAAADCAQDDVSILDIGTGGGFPLLPLAILFPKVSFTGLDSTTKKIDAIRRICETMEITNVDLIAGRCEELGRDSNYREQFDIVTARAVAPLNTLLEYMSPFIRKGGHALCWKSMNIDDEELASIDARMAVNLRLIDKVVYDLDKTGLQSEVGGVGQGNYSQKMNDIGKQVTSCAGWGKRQILVFEKTGELSGEYPRAVGIPKKEPL